MKYLYSICMLIMWHASFSQNMTFTVLDEIEPGSESGISENACMLAVNEENVFFVSKVKGEKQLFRANAQALSMEPILSLGSAGYVIDDVLFQGDWYVSVRLTSEFYVLYRVHKNDITVIHSSPFVISNLAVLDNDIYFLHKHEDGDEVIKYKTVANSISVQFKLDKERINEMTFFQDELFFISWNEEGGRLMKFHPQQASTEHVFSFHNTTDFADDINFTIVSNRLYFWYQYNGSPYVLFRTDGTGDGTEILNENLIRIPFFDYKKEKAMCVHEDKLYFRGKSKSTLEEDLYVVYNYSDEVQKIRLDPLLPLQPKNLMVFGSRVYFHGLYKHSPFGNEEGICVLEGSLVHLVFDRFDMPEGYAHEGQAMSVFDNMLYYTAETDKYGDELWRISSLELDSEMVLDISPGEVSSKPSQIRKVGDKIVFFATHLDHGRELFIAEETISNSIENPSRNELSIMPNPSSVGQVVYLCEGIKAGEFEICIYCNDGRVVYCDNDVSSGQERLRIATDKLISGIYYVVVRQDDFQMTSALVVW